MGFCQLGGLIRRYEYGLISRAVSNKSLLGRRGRAGDLNPGDEAGHLAAVLLGG